MVNRKIIGITGLQGSGKSTIGNIICKEVANWKHLSFASALKDTISVLFGLDRKLLEGDTTESRIWREQPDEYWSKKMRKTITPRGLLQFVGTEVLRNHLYQNIWVDCLEKKILDSDENIVITDVRFKNEIDMIRRLNGSIVRVQRGELPSWFKECEMIGQGTSFDYSGIKGLENVHPSEYDWIGYDKPDHIFQNDGTLKDLEDEVIEYIVKKY